MNQFDLVSFLTQKVPFLSVSSGIVFLCLENFYAPFPSLLCSSVSLLLEESNLRTDLLVGWDGLEVHQRSFAHVLQCTITLRLVFVCSIQRWVLIWLMLLQLGRKLLSRLLLRRLFYFFDRVLNASGWLLVRRWDDEGCAGCSLCLARLLLLLQGIVHDIRHSRGGCIPHRLYRHCLAWLTFHYLRELRYRYEIDRVNQGSFRRCHRRRSLVFAEELGLSRGLIGLLTHILHLR